MGRRQEESGLSRSSVWAAFDLTPLTRNAFGVGVSEQGSRQR